MKVLDKKFSFLLPIKNNNLSILTSSIFNIKDIEKNKVDEMLRKAEEETNKDNVSDQVKFLIDQKIEVLKSIN